MRASTSESGWRTEMIDSFNPLTNFAIDVKTFAQSASFDPQCGVPIKTMPSVASRIC